MKRWISVLLCICLILGVRTPVQAAQDTYSTKANSGVRHEVCTSLEGTGAADYYTGAYTYDALSGQCGDQLLSTLRTLLTTTHTTKTTYSQCRDLAVKTDCENGDGTTISLIYTSYSAVRSDYINDRSRGWNREHVWPKSQGGFTEKETPGADLHHVRPSDSGINSTRGNKIYGEVTGGKSVTGAGYTGNAQGGTSGGTYFEPLDQVKGDVARICLYMYVRYGAEYSKCGKITNVFQSVEVLLDWCALDPVDTWEMGRNEVVSAIQGNRNVFIDYPELAWLLFEEQIPADLVTPSGGAVQVCRHTATTVKNAREASCTEKGYTGDTYCKDCGGKLESGSSVAALGHSNDNGDDRCDRCGKAVDCAHGKSEIQNLLEPSCGADGYTGDTVCSYCERVLEQGIEVPATGEHSFGEWEVTLAPTVEAEGLQKRSCQVCGAEEETALPKLEPVSTDPPAQPTEPEKEPATEPDTEPAQTQPEGTQNTTQPSEDPQMPPAQKEDYRWLVYAVIGAGAVTSVVIVLIQTKRKK